MLFVERKNRFEFRQTSNRTSIPYFGNCQHLSRFHLPTLEAGKVEIILTYTYVCQLLNRNEHHDNESLTFSLSNPTRSESEKLLNRNGCSTFKKLFDRVSGFENTSNRVRTNCEYRDAFWQVLTIPRTTFSVRNFSSESVQCKN